MSARNYRVKIPRRNRKSRERGGSRENVGKKLHCAADIRRKHVHRKPRRKQ